MKAKMPSGESKDQSATPPTKLQQLFDLKPFRFVANLSDLFIYKFFCLLLYGSYGGLYPYLPLYFKQLGLGANQAGTIVGTRPVVQCLGAPFWGTLADRYKAGRIILMGGVMAWVVKAFLILAVQPQNQQCIEVYVNVSGNRSETLIYARNLWKLNGDEKWVTVPLVKKPVIIQKNKLVKVGPGRQFKNVNLRPTARPTTVPANISAKASEHKVNANHNRSRSFSSDTAMIELVQDAIDIDIAGPYLLSHVSEVQGKNYQAREEGKVSEKSVKPSNISSSDPTSASDNKDKDTRQPKQTLIGIGKVIAHTVKKFDKSLNATVTFVTQLDTSELYHLFVIFTLFMVIGEFLESPTYTLSDSSLLKCLGEQVDKYGLVRMFGSLGAGIAVAVVGGIVYTSRFELCATIQQNYMVAFYIYIVLASGAFFTVLGFSFEYHEEPAAEPAFKEAASLLLHPRCLAFMVTAWFAGMCFGFLFHYVNWFIDDINGHAITMGVAGAVREFSGISIFFLGGHVLKLMGYVNCLACGLIAYITVMFSYSVLTVPWFAVALEAVSGGTYALIWSTCIGYFNTVGRSVKNRASLQGILQGVFWGLGNGGGTVISGFLYHNFGPKTTFRAFGIAGLVVLAFFVIVQRFCCTGEQADERGEETGYEAVASKEEESKKEPESESAKQEGKPAMVDEKTH